MKILKSTSKICFGLAMLSMITACDPIGPGTTPPSDETIELVGNAKNVVQMANEASLTWNNGTVKYSGVTKITKDQLTQAGTHIIGIRVYMANASDLSVFAGNDYENPSVTKDHKFERNGWQYVIFDKQDQIQITEDVYIGFNTTSTHIVVDQSSKITKDELIFVDGQWAKLYELLGGYAYWPIQAIVAGGKSYSSDEYDILLDNISVKAYAVSGQTTPVACEVMNGGYRTIGNITVNCELGGKTVSVPLNNITLRKGETHYLEIPGIEAPASSETVTAKISVSSSDITTENSKNNSMSAQIRIYTEYLERNRLLIEQFTGQSCPNCPAGSATMANAIQGMNNPEKACWMAHHAGYYDDNFTLSDSKNIAQKLRVSGAPMCNINRMSANTEGGNNLIWHPGYATSQLLDELAGEPGLATLKIDRTYNTETKELTVKVTGKSLKESAFITAIVTQSNIEATQSGVQGSYKHNNAPRKFLSSGMGDELELDSEGNYSKEFTWTIEEKVGTFDCKPEDMDVVVFVHGNINSTKECAVYNADKVSVME